MAAPTRTPSTFVNFNNEAPNQELSFQEFTFDSADKSEPPPDYSEYPNDNVADTSRIPSQLLEGEQSEAKSGPGFWEFKYYQQFFDVNTDQVLSRIFWSMIPLPGRATFLHRCVQPTPDLYGPFWICATLVFTIAIGGNLSDYLHTAGKSQQEWRYDFQLVSLAATTIYCYAFLVPLAVFAFLWYRRNLAGYSLLDLVCLYGYSLAIYVPISILCVIQVRWLQIILVIIGTCLSGSVLTLTLWSAVKEDAKKITWISLLIVLALHALMAFGFLEYFFMASSDSTGDIVADKTLAPATTIVQPTGNNTALKS